MEKEVVVSINNSDGQVVLVDKLNVDDNACDYEKDAHYATHNLRLPHNHGKERDENEYLHVHLDWPCHLIAARVWIHLFWPDVSYHIESWNPILSTCSCIDLC